MLPVRDVQWNDLGEPTQVLNRSTPLPNKGFAQNAWPLNVTHCLVTQNPQHRGRDGAASRSSNGRLEIAEDRRMFHRYLVDFAVGQTFSSDRLCIDEERIKSFAAEFASAAFSSRRSGSAAHYIPRSGSQGSARGATIEVAPGPRAD